MPFLSGDKARPALLLTDDPGGHVQAKELSVHSKEKVLVTAGARGGFVLMVR